MRATGKNIILGLEIKEKVGNLYLPDKSHRATHKCEVRHVGPLVEKRGNIKVGDIVLKPDLVFVRDKREQGYDLMDGDVKCMVVEESDIRVILERPNAGGD